MMNRHFLVAAGFAAASLFMAGGMLHAAVLSEDFESYDTGSLSSQTSPYATKGDPQVAQDSLDAVNSTQVLSQVAGDETDAPKVNLTGKINFSIDFKLTSGQNTNIYLTKDSTDRLFWIQILGSSDLIRLRSDDGSKTLLSQFTDGQWYRLQAAIYVDANDGANSTIQSTDLYTLNTGGEIDQLVGHVDSVNAYGAADVAVSPYIGGTGSFDNWQVSQVPEPASLALLGLAGVLLVRRRCS